jgi:hypothetical protein
MRYFVQDDVMLASTLEMAKRLTHICRDMLQDCVVSDDTVIRAVQILQEKQMEIAKENPRLRRVEINAVLNGRFRNYIEIGSHQIPLRPVKRIIEDGASL